MSIAFNPLPNKFKQCWLGLSLPDKSLWLTVYSIGLYNIQFEYKHCKVWSHRMSFNAKQDKLTQIRHASTFLPLDTTAKLAQFSFFTRSQGQPKLVQFQGSTHWSLLLQSGIKALHTQWTTNHSLFWSMYQTKQVYFGRFIKCSPSKSKG